MKLTYNIFLVEYPAHGAEEKEEVQEEKEEVIRSSSLSDPYLWRPWCSDTKSRADDQASWNGYS